MSTISALLKPLGFSLDEKQPHVSGERYLMSSNKLVLAGFRDSDNTKIIIKTSRVPEGRKEIESEKEARDLMRSLSFANKKIVIPEEMYYGSHGNYVFLITRFIPQEKVFVAHTLKEQFFTALSALEAQESFHATTYEHIRAVKNIFPVLSSAEYIRDFARLEKSIQRLHKQKELADSLKKACDFLSAHRATIDRYTSYLAHTDFVPHNFRICNSTLYVLDCAPNYATIHFGNKYEGWARFLNYMLIHNPTLEGLLAEHVRKHRGEDEYLSLRLMRVYKIAFLIEYYARSLSKTEGDLHELTLIRLAYWRNALEAILDDRKLPEEITERYKAVRDTLRSDEEKERQREFAIA